MDEFSKNEKIKDYRVELLAQYHQLFTEWDKNNSLYNTLMFSKLYNDHVENSEIVVGIMGNQNMRNDIMTSWWTPTKYFLFHNTKESRLKLTQYLLENISKENDVNVLQKELSEIRYGKNSNEKIDVSVIKAFMKFLGSIYAIGNMTNAAVTTRGGALDNWDAKLTNIKGLKRYSSKQKWKKYVEDNYFQDYFDENDKEYSKVCPFWSYGSSKLADATDNAWKEYFENVSHKIELREKRINNTHNIENVN